MLILATKIFGMTTHMQRAMPLWDIYRLTMVETAIRCIYLVAGLYMLIPKLGKIGFLMVDDLTVNAIYKRVEIVLGIYMIFKLTIEFIKMLANPDIMSDKEKGIGGILKRTAIALVLLAVTPFIFKELYVIQNRVLEDNLIGKIIMVDRKASLKPETIGGYGFEMGWYAMNAFYFIEEPDKPCGEGFDWSVFGDGFSIDSIVKAYRGVMDAINNAPITAGIKAVLPNSNGTIDDEGIREIFANPYSFPGVAGGQAILYLCSVSKKNTSGVSILGVPIDLGSTFGTYEYSVTYFPLICNCFMIYVLWLLLSHCFAIALRAVQLAFLQIIAPVPILSYIDKKDGTFSKWVSQCIDVFLDLFLRLASLYFTMFLLHKLNSSTDNIISNLQNTISSVKMPFPVMAVNIEKEMNTLLYRFVIRPIMIIGVLKFSKKVPEMVKELFPRKSAAAVDYTEPDKKIGGTIGGAVVSGLTMAAGNAINRINYNRSEKKSMMQNAQAARDAGNLKEAKKWEDRANAIRTTRGVGMGVLSGLGRGTVQGGYKGYKGGVSGAFSAAISSNKSYGEWLAAGGTNEIDALGYSILKSAGLTTPYDSFKQGIDVRKKGVEELEDSSKRIQSAASSSKAAHDVAADQFDKHKGTGYRFVVDSNGNVAIGSDGKPKVEAVNRNINIDRLDSQAKKIASVADEKSKSQVVFRDLASLTGSLGEDIFMDKTESEILHMVHKAGMIEFNPKTKEYSMNGPIAEADLYNMLQVSSKTEYEKQLGKVKDMFFTDAFTHLAATKDKDLLTKMAAAARDLGTITDKDSDESVINEKLVTAAQKLLDRYKETGLILEGADGKFTANKTTYDDKELNDKLDEFVKKLNEATSGFMTDKAKQEFVDVEKALKDKIEALSTKIDAVAQQQKDELRDLEEDERNKAMKANQGAK